MTTTCNCCQTLLTIDDEANSSILIGTTWYVEFAEDRVRQLLIFGSESHRAVEGNDNSIGKDRFCSIQVSSDLCNMRGDFRSLVSKENVATTATDTRDACYSEY